MNKSWSERSGRKTLYASRNIDSEIDRLERVLAGEGADSMFARTYWRARVIEVRGTPGLIAGQLERLERLLGRFAEA